LTEIPAPGDFQLIIETIPEQEVIYRYNFSTLYREWQTTQVAEHSKRYFNESVIMPLPKNTSTIKLRKRDKNLEFQPMLEFVYNPAEAHSLDTSKNQFPATKIYGSGSPSKRVDLVFIPEGYTIKEMEKFKQDVERFSEYLFSWKPYTEYKKTFNLWMIEAPSPESGTDIPGENLWKNTLLNSRFYTLNSERYLSVQDIPLLKDVASPVPYDHIVILVNSAKYGGGGIYNQYSITSVDHPNSETVFLHELGHGLAGLADEYSSEAAYSNYHATGMEPLEANITNLVDFERKWKDMVPEGTPIPTPDFEQYNKVVGVFEGAGYTREGLYRPYRNCSMRANLQDGFCPVCQKAIMGIIWYYTGKPVE
jgi:hypothetical protein